MLRKQQGKVLEYVGGEWVNPNEQPVYGIHLDRIIECPHCQGGGIAIHPLWKDYYKLCEQRGVKYYLSSESKEEELMIEYWTRYLSEEDAYPDLILSGNCLPPEEIDCPKCDGEGKVLETLHLRLPESSIHSFMEQYFHQKHKQRAKKEPYRNLSDNL